MATLVLTGNVGSLLRLSKELTAVLASGAENKSVTVTLQDTDFSIQYTDGAYGTQTKKCK